MSSDESAVAVSTSSWVASILTSLLWRGTQLTFVLGSLVATLLYFKQESLLYFPEIGGIPRRPDGNPRKYRSPAEHNVHFEDVKMPCEDGVHIHGWLMLRTPAANNPLPTLVYFHGNAGNIGLRLPNALQMMQYLNVNILLVEYRGYGNSDDASPNEAGLKLDGRAALEFARKHPNLNKDKIFLFGRSLGGAVAFSLAEYAQQKNISLAGVIVENTFMGISAMVDHLMPLVAPLKGLILKMKWDSTVIVPNLQCPVLYLAGAADQLVPHEHMQTLHRLTAQSKLNKMHVVPDGTHNETWVRGGKEYWTAIREFLAGAIEVNSKFPMGGATLGGTSVTTSTASDSRSVTSGTASIPTMSNKLFGMVKDAVGSDKKSDEKGKKDL
jgi:pimeloyl-ACP methyl ester carboxylesterase